MTLDRISGAFLFLLALFVAWEDRVLPLGTHGHPGPGYFPLLLSVLLGILGLLLFLRGRSSAHWRSIRWEEAGHAAAILACSFLATFGIERLGYRITMILILGFLFGVVERLKVWQVFVLTIGLSLGSFWVFDSLLRVILPRGGFGF
ncbi:MAG TPA: tripartite tricarboxylate transporter TctB family protein [Thermodesulfobacteriota bacterium]|nr:tripartite tricarboxylate transporter TctB family protein [Thermodesulfobacteriota bacterium]